MNKTKLFISLFVGSMLLLSIYLGYQLSQNMRQDSSQKRGKLTKEYKKIKDINYIYDEKLAMRTYNNLCSKCHGANLKGSDFYPSLIDSKVTKDKLKFVKVLTNGLNGKMPAFNFIPNKDLTDLINYIAKLNLTHKELLDLKLEIVQRDKPWTKEEL